MSGWLWGFVGVVLILLEMVVPLGFFLLLLGVAAILVGIVVQSTTLLASLEWQLFSFAVVAVVLFFGLGTTIRRLFARRQRFSSNPQGQEVVVEAELQPGTQGSAKLWGTVWQVKNIGQETIPAGSRAVVSAASGITLHVKRHHGSQG